MKFAATVLYEDKRAEGPMEFALHTLVTWLVVDALPGATFHLVKRALDGRPMKGVDNVLNAVADAVCIAPNGRALLGCIDGDRLALTLTKRQHASLTSFNATLIEKAVVIELAYNTEALLTSAAELLGATRDERERAIAKKDRLARDLLFRRLAADRARRQAFLAAHAGVAAVVAFLAPRVTAFLAPPRPMTRHVDDGA